MIIAGGVLGASVKHHNQRGGLREMYGDIHASAQCAWVAAEVGEVGQSVLVPRREIGKVHGPYFRYLRDRLTQMSHFLPPAQAEAIADKKHLARQIRCCTAQ